jgi:hypothetical protein
MHRPCYPPESGRRTCRSHRRRRSYSPSGPQPRGPPAPSTTGRTRSTPISFLQLRREVHSLHPPSARARPPTAKHHPLLDNRCEPHPAPGSPERAQEGPKSGQEEPRSAPAPLPPAPSSAPPESTTARPPRSKPAAAPRNSSLGALHGRRQRLGHARPSQPAPTSHLAPSSAATSAKLLLCASPPCSGGPLQLHAPRTLSNCAAPGTSPPARGEPVRAR